MEHKLILSVEVGTQVRWRNVRNSPIGEVTKIDFNQFGALVSVRWPDGHVSRFSLDDCGRLLDVPLAPVVQ